MGETTEFNIALDLKVGANGTPLEKIEASIREHLNKMLETELSKALPAELEEWSFEIEVQRSREQALACSWSDIIFELDHPNSTRLEACARKAGVVMMEEMTRKSKNDLLALHGVGLSTIWDVEEILNEYGLRLREEICSR